MVIQTMAGLGDCIYLRPVLRKLPPQSVTLNTAWPQVFMDLGITKFIKPQDMRLRTQSDNINQFPASFWQPYEHEHLTPTYLDNKKNITANFCDHILGEQPTWLNNDWHYETKPRTGKPICLIRPTTLRREWYITSRGPKPEYLQAFVDKYKDQYHIISVASIKGSEEWYEKKIEGCAEYIEDAPTFEETFAMFAAADLIVCTVSFWVPLALAMNKKTICIYGGHVPPERIVDPRIRRPNYKELVPNPFCSCYQLVHNCNKFIPSKAINAVFEEQTC